MQFKSNGLNPSVEDIALCYQNISQSKPVIHNITNYVVMNPSANALLAIGASPIMAHASEEMDEITNLSNALVINIGTLSTPWVKSMEQACVIAKSKNIPIILDPVGAGATQFRTQTALRLINNGYPDIIRGNGSEIAALVNQESNTRGVESTQSSESVIEAAKEFAKKSNIIVCISGKDDYITDGTTTAKISNGNAIMSQVTGMGCISSALVGAFAASNKNFLQSTISAMATMGICGEKAINQSTGPGTFQMHFFDALSSFSLQDIEKHMRIEYV